MKNKIRFRNKTEKKPSKLPVVVLLCLLIAACAVTAVVAVVSLRPVTLVHVTPEMIACETAETQPDFMKAADDEDGDGLLPADGDEAVIQANYMAMQYDYDGAVNRIKEVDGYESSDFYNSCIEKYEELKAQTVEWTDYDKITHIFFHSLIVDTDLAFSSEKKDDYNEVMTTVDEFKKIIQSMYDKGYVLISLHKIAKPETAEDGSEQMVKQEIRLPIGKKPFVLSQDDVCYYEYMEGHGFATKLCLDNDGKVVNEYIEKDGSISYGSYDVLTILEDFIAKHPDFSYQGSKGILAFTGYDGVLGYRTSDFWYNDSCDYYISTPGNDEEKIKEHTSPNLNIEQDKQTAAKVAQAIRELGWELASHSWGHPNLQTTSYEHFVWDTDMWEREVEPIIGESDIILYPLGADIGGWQMSQYSADNPRYAKLHDVGFRYFCNVDSAQYWVQIGDDFFRQGRRNMDGQMMYKQIVYPEKMLTEDLFDAKEVFDAARPIPVQGVTLPSESAQ